MIINEINNLIEEIKKSESLQPNMIRKNIYPGLKVQIVLKQHQRTNILTEGIVEKILTSKPTHTRGIKVRLETGHVGRVQCIFGKQKCKKINN